MTEEQIKSKAKEQFPNDEFKQWIVIDAINWATKELQKENANLKDVIEGYKKIAKWCDKCDKLADLEEELKKWKYEWQEQVQKATDEGYARTLQTIQLSKAKELLKRWVELYKPKLEGYPITPIQEQTEQFLSEVEK